MLAAWILCFSLFADSNPETLGPNFVEGVKALESKNYAPAQEIFNRLLAQYPHNTSVLFNTGLAEFHLDRAGRALGLWRKARSLGDNSSDLHSAIQMAETALGLQAAGDQTFRWVSDVINQPPHWLILALVVVLFLALGRQTSIYFARRRLPFLSWPIYLQATLCLWVLLLGLLSFQIYQGSLLKGTVAEKDLVTVATPSENAPSLSTLREGEWVFLEDEQPGWWRIRSQTGAVGWVRASALIPFGGYN